MQQAPCECSERLEIYIPCFKLVSICDDDCGEMFYQLLTCARQSRLAPQYGAARQRKLNTHSKYIFLNYAILLCEVVFGFIALSSNCD